MAGLAVTVVLLLAAVYDQFFGHYFAAHSAALYGNLDPGPSAMFTFAYAFLAAGVICWYVVRRGARSERRWTLTFAILVFLVALGITGYAFSVTEYGGYVFPPLWRALMLLPSISGVIAIAILFRVLKKAPR